MKNFTLLITLVFLVSCSSSSILDKVFQYKFYEGLDYELLIKAPEVSESDLFLIHYTIIRQRDYFNYTVEGKTYGEILAMAKEFQQNGFPVDIKMNKNGEQDKIKVTASADGVGYTKKKGNNKRVLKTLKFSGKFENVAEKDVVLLNSSFIVRGPFGDYITSVNYEINCILNTKDPANVGFIVPGKVIQKNLLFEGNPHIQRLIIDNIINQLTVEPSGTSVKDEGRYFKECFFNASVMEPQVIIEYSKSLKDKEWKSKTGEIYTLDFGDSHIPPDLEEVIQMR